MRNATLHIHFSFDTVPHILTKSFIHYTNQYTFYMWKYSLLSVYMFGIIYPIFAEFYTKI
jgi:hypothetical protein